MVDAVGCSKDIHDVSPGENVQQVQQRFLKLDDDPKVGHEFAKIKTKVTHARIVARATCVHTNESLDSNLKLETALQLARDYLGPACPPEEIIRKDAFRALAIAFSLTIRKTVSPKRVYACFARRDHQGTDLTDYGRSRLLDENKASWPPIMSPTFRQPTTVADLITGFLAREGFLERQHADPGEEIPAEGDEVNFDDLLLFIEPPLVDGNAGTVGLDCNEFGMPLDQGIFYYDSAPIQPLVDENAGTVELDCNEFGMDWERGMD